MVDGGNQGQGQIFRIFLQHEIAKRHSPVVAGKLSHSSPFKGFQFSKLWELM
jgi:hypothetical protein